MLESVDGIYRHTRSWSIGPPFLWVGSEQRDIRSWWSRSEAVAAYDARSLLAVQFFRIWRQLRHFARKLRPTGSAKALSFSTSKFWTLLDSNNDSICLLCCVGWTLCSETGHIVWAWIPSDLSSLVSQPSLFPNYAIDQTYSFFIVPFSSSSLSSLKFCNFSSTCVSSLERTPERFLFPSSLLLPVDLGTSHLLSFLHSIRLKTETKLLQLSFPGFTSAPSHDLHHHCSIMLLCSPPNYPQILTWQQLTKKPGSFGLDLIWRWWISSSVSRSFCVMNWEISVCQTYVGCSTV